jgi:hypothetical protein
MSQEFDLLKISKYSLIILGISHLLNAAFTFGYEQQFFLRAITFLILILVWYVLSNMKKVDNSGHEVKMVFIFIILFIYNPIIPVHFGSREAWLAPNILSGLYLLYLFFFFDKLIEKLKKSNKPNVILK